MLGGLFKNAGTELIGSVGSVIDNLSTSNKEKHAAKAELTKIVQDSLTKVLELQSQVLKTEMSGTWLQSSWRPILMLAFTSLLILRWTGIANPALAPALELELMSIIKLGLGGYIGARSVEKVATTVTRNIDMSFLKKKNRDRKRDTISDSE